jgi:hypothetical protein
MEKYPLIRKVYLYLFSMVGLVLIIIGTARFVDMGLKTYVFKLAYQQEKLNYDRVVPVPEFLERKVAAGAGSATTVALTEEEFNQVQYLIDDYKNWQERQDTLNPVLANKHRDASINLSLILVGCPLYLYHWLTIRKELKNKV